MTEHHRVSDDSANNGGTRLAKKVLLYCSAIVAFITVMTFVNKWFIADPIQQAVSDERIARQFADSLIIVRLSQLRSGQVATANSAVEVSDDVAKARSALGIQLKAIRDQLDDIEAKQRR